MEYKDYYQTLGVSKTASQDEIKKAYRKLARQLHPDVNPGDQSAEDKFKDINEAYEVLGDPDKRQKYDQLGAQWQQWQQTGGQPGDFDWGRWTGQPGGSYTYRTVTPDEFQDIFSGNGGGFSDFFEMLFGGRGGRSRAGSPFDDWGFQARTRPGQDVQHTVDVTLEEAFSGTTRVLQWEDGRRIEARIPQGVKTSSRVRLSGQGQPGSGGASSGDLYLDVNVLPHGVFTREGDDLRRTVPIDLYTALLGGTVQVAALDRTVDLKIPAGTQNGRTFRLRGLGMPNLRQPDQRGDLYVTVDVRLPEHLTDEERRIVEQLRALQRRAAP